jgi:ATP-dependent DNA helicase RecG
MDITTQDVIQMVRSGESSTVEFKECGKALPKEVWLTYSAFANTHGGWIILGIKEHSDRLLPDKFEIVGVPDTDKIIQEIGSTLDNQQKVSRNLLTNDDITVLEINNAKVIVLHVPEADYRLKPIYLNSNKVTHSYKRTQQGDAHVTDEELSMMLRDADATSSDLTLMEHFDMNDIDIDSLHKYRTNFNLRNPGHVFSDKEDKDFLRNMGGYIVDRATGKEGLSLAGLMMFGKGLSIRERFPGFRMDYLDLVNVPKGSSLKWNDRLTYDGRWENNLYNFISYVMSKIGFGIPTHGVVQGVQRNDDSMVLKALREGVTNAVIHCDIRIDGVLRIDKHEDSIIIRNPGMLKLSKEKIYEGNHTRSRNPKIQDMLRMIGYGDNIGSGFPLILRTWEEESWVKPDLNEDRESHEVTLTLTMSSLHAAETITAIRKVYGNDFEYLGKDDKEILVLLTSQTQLTNSELQSLTGNNGWEINRILTTLVNKNLILSSPKGRWTTYTINSNYVPSPQPGIAKDLVLDVPEALLKKLNDKQKSIIKRVINNPTITMQNLGDEMGLSINQVRQQRRSMERLVRMERVGSDKKGEWRFIINEHVNL